MPRITAKTAVNAAVSGTILGSGLQDRPAPIAFRAAMLHWFDGKTGLRLASPGRD